MKKEIMQLVNSEDGTLRLNNISILRRWTKNGLGDRVDRLEIEFDNINDVCFSIYDTSIKSRDYEGIMRECEEHTKRFLEEVESTLISNMRAGYRNKY